MLYIINNKYVLSHDFKLVALNCFTQNMFCLFDIKSSKALLIDVPMHHINRSPCEVASDFAYAIVGDV